MTRNRRGPTSLPCGNPPRRSFHSDAIPFILVHYSRLIKKVFPQLKTGHSVSNFSRTIVLVFSTISYVFWTSNKAIRKMVPIILLTVLDQQVCSRSNHVQFKEHNCVLLILFPVKSMIRSRTTFSNYLVQMLS